MEVVVKEGGAPLAGEAVAQSILAAVATPALPTGAATEVTLAAASAKLPASLGPKTSALSLSVVEATDSPGKLQFNAVPTTRTEAQVTASQGDELGSTLVALSKNIAGENLELDVLGTIDKPTNDSTFHDSFDIAAALEASTQVGGSAAPVTLFDWQVQVMDPTLATGTYQVQFADSTAIPAGSIAVPAAFTQFIQSFVFKHTLGDFTVVSGSVPGNGKKAALSLWIWVSAVAAGATPDPASKSIVGSNSFVFTASYKA